jgi:UrcA family protein
MTRNRLRISIFLFASLAAANPVLAGQHDGRIVSYGDLDLTTSAGQATLDRRLAGAIRQVCGMAFPSDIQSVSQVRRCRADTLADVQAQRNDALAQARNSAVQLAARR